MVTAVKEGTVTITVTTQDGGKRATCVVRVTVPVLVSDYIIINGLKWAKGNLVSTGNNTCKIGTPTDYGLYFHFGGLVGWGGGSNGDGTGAGGSPTDAVVKVKPVGYIDKIPEWPAGYYYQAGTTYDKGYSLPTTDDAIDGIGDPCRYYLGGTWRTPTATEWLTLIGENGDKTNMEYLTLSAQEVGKFC